MVTSEIDWKKVVEVMVLKPEQMVDIDYSELIKKAGRGNDNCKRSANLEGYI